MYRKKEKDINTTMDAIGKIRTSPQHPRDHRTWPNLNVSVPSIIAAVGSAGITSSAIKAKDMGCMDCGDIL
jgi:hypothetical protein